MSTNNISEDYIVVSVIVPSFNVSYVAESTANSLMNQSYPKDKYEVIWIDDASQDGTFDKVNSVKAQYDNLHLFKNKINKGRNWSRNFGASLAKGEILIFLDSDNVVNRDFVKAHASLHTGNRCMGLGNFAVRSEQYFNNFVKYWNSRSPEQLIKSGIINDEDIPPKYLCTANCSFRKSDFNAIGGSLEILSQADDDYLGYKFSELGLKLQFAKKAISDHRDPSFKIKQYFTKFKKQGKEYSIISQEYPYIINISKYKYLSPISKDDKLPMIFLKRLLLCFFTLKLPLPIFYFAEHRENANILRVPFMFYRIILAYAFYLGFRNAKTIV